MYLWDAPMNSLSIWFSRANLKRCSIGWSDLKGKRDNHTFWWAIFGFSGTVTIQTWPFQGVIYRAVMKLSHRFNWHHTRTLRPEGDVVLYCSWCGLQYTKHKAAKVISIDDGPGRERSGDLRE